jgi:hypothetical protein
VATTLKVAVAPAVTVSLCGSAVIEGAVPVVLGSLEPDPLQAAAPIVNNARRTMSER